MLACCAPRRSEGEHSTLVQAAVKYEVTSPFFRDYFPENFDRGRIGIAQIRQQTSDQKIFNARCSCIHSSVEKLHACSSPRCSPGIARSVKPPRRYLSDWRRFAEVGRYREADAMLIWFFVAVSPRARLRRNCRWWSFLVEFRRARVVEVGGEVPCVHSLP